MKVQEEKAGNQTYLVGKAQDEEKTKERECMEDKKAEMRKQEEILCICY